MTQRRPLAPIALVSALLGLAGPAAAADWPQFRGPNRDGISTETGLLRAWPTEGPKVLWKTKVCQGYAGAAVKAGRVYVNDYDPETKEHWVRCISLADGKDIWGWRWKAEVKPLHGITRTVPAVGEKLVFSMDPNCGFHALDAETGKLVWQKLLVDEYKAEIQPWKAGQNPLLDGDRVVIATGGQALVVAYDQATGKEVWQAPNPEKWILTHSSVMPAEIGGVKQFVYLHMRGVAGVSAADGSLLWSVPFKGKMAVAPSPLPIGDGRIFITSGYEAGSEMLRVDKTAAGLAAAKLWDLTAKQFNSEVHTPILWKDHLFAVGSQKKGRFTCMDLDGKVVWESPIVEGDRAASRTFGLGSFLFADGRFFILDGDSGMLRLVEASTTGYKELASAPVLAGEDVWGPMALSDGKLILRDMKQMVCIQVSGAPAK